MQNAGLCRALLIVTALFALDTFTPSQSIVVSEVLDIISVAKDVIVAVAKTWQLVDDHFDYTETPTLFMEKTERKLFQKMDNIQRKVDELNSEIEAVGTRTISGFMRVLPDRIKLELRLNNLLDYMTRTQVFYKNMYYYVNSTEFERLTLEDFAKTVVSHDSGSVRSLLERIHAFISSSERGLTDTGILGPIAESLKWELQLTPGDSGKSSASVCQERCVNVIQRETFEYKAGDPVILMGIYGDIPNVGKLQYMKILTMLNLKLIVCIVTTIICVHGYQRLPVPVKVDKLRQDFLNLEEKLWNQVLDHEDNTIGVVSDKQNNVAEVQLIREFEIFGDLLQKEFPEDISHGLNALESVWVWARTYSELRGIYALYESFRRFQKLQTAQGRIPSPRQAWVDLSETILRDSKSSIPEAENRIAEFIASERLFDEARKEVEGDMQCSTNQSPQQVLYNLYNSIALTELKGYMMMQFSYMLLKLYNRGNFTKEAQIMRDRYEERTNTAIDAVKKVMEPASKELWKCDPKKHIKDETYIEVTQLLQGYIQNEVDLNPEGTCRETCSEYTYTKSHNCFKNLYCRQQRRCNGKIINCKFVDSDMWVCPADPFSGRRYEYVEYENGRTLGRKQGCSKGRVKVDSWWRWLFWHCSYCFCLCDEQGIYSDRYFNMRSVIADIENNRVVTGLRFVKKNRIIHLQIQQGKLMPRGNVDPSTVEWAPVEDYKITDRNIYNGQDYHTLSWEHRSIDLDDLMSDEGHLVTGIRFKKIGSHLNFEIYITPFNFTSGVLVEPIDRSIWKDNSNTDVSPGNPRKRLDLRSPDVPIRSPSPSVPDSKSDQYVEFTHTDMDRDAAQTTVPFLDAQPVESLLPVPLSGAGIYHKGRRDFGGFIAPKIITYDFSMHLQAGFPESEAQINK